MVSIRYRLGVDLVAGHLHDHGFPRDEVVEPVESGGFEVVPTLFGQGYWLDAGQIDRARPIECGEVGWQGVEEASLGFGLQGQEGVRWG